MSAQFFQSPLDLPRTDILREVAAGIAGGGLLRVVDHGAGPPGSSHHDVVFPGVTETLDELALPASLWAQVRVEQSTRVAPGHDGHDGEFVDNVIALRRI